MLIVWKLLDDTLVMSSFRREKKQGLWPPSYRVFVFVIWIDFLIEIDLLLFGQLFCSESWSFVFALVEDQISQVDGPKPAQQEKRSHYKLEQPHNHVVEDRISSSFYPSQNWPWSRQQNVEQHHDLGVPMWDFDYGHFMQFHDTYKIVPFIILLN